MKPISVSASLSPAQRQEEAVEELAKEIFNEPFDLVQGPLYRVEVLRRSADHHVLVFAIHHAIADGWTLGVFVQDLCIAYVQGLMGLQEGLPPLPLTYAAWGAAERAVLATRGIGAAGRFLEIQSRRKPPALEIAGGTRDRIRCAPSIGFAHSGRLWPTPRGNWPASLAQRSSAHCWQRFRSALSRWTGEEDILVGTPVANRTRQAVRETMGYFAGIVPLRGQVDADRPFSDSLSAVHQATVDSFANAMPFAELVPALGDLPAPGHNPVFEVRFALQNHPVPDVALHGLSARLRMRSTGTARFHLGCEITVVEDGLEVVWLFRPNLFPLAEIENLSYMFQGRACRRLPLTGKSDRRPMTRTR